MTQSPVIGYIHQQDKGTQEALLAIHQAIKEVLPEAQEKNSYGMPTYWQGRNIIHFANQTQHFGIYPGTYALEVLADKVKDFSTSKGTLRIDKSEKLPLELIQELALTSLEHSQTKSKKSASKSSSSKYQPKTQVTDQDPLAYIQSIEKDRKRQDSLVLLELFKEVTQEPPKMWGPSVIGFESYEYDCGSYTAQATRIGFAPGKSNHLTLYVIGEETPEQRNLLDKLGKHKKSKACLYINKLADVDMDVLEALICYSWEQMNKKYPLS